MGKPGKPGWPVTGEGCATGGGVVNRMTVI